MTDGQRLDEALKNWIAQMRHGIHELREWSLRLDELAEEARSTLCHPQDRTPETRELLATLWELGEEWERLVMQGK